MSSTILHKALVGAAIIGALGLVACKPKPTADEAASSAASEAVAAESSAEAASSAASAESSAAAAASSTPASQ